MGEFVSGHFLRLFSPLVLISGNYLSLSGGKELTPLPPQEEKSSSPSPLPTLGPLWGATGEGDDAADKELPAAEGSGVGDGGTLLFLVVGRRYLRHLGRKE